MSCHFCNSLNVNWFQNVISSVSGEATTIPLPTSLPFKDLESLGSKIAIPASENREPSTYVALSGAKTIPIPSQGPYPTTTISGVPNVIIGIPGQTTSIQLMVSLPSGFSGSTTVIRGPDNGKLSTYLVLTGPITLPIPSQTIYPTTIVSSIPKIIIGSPDQTMRLPLTVPLPSGFKGSTTILSASGTDMASTYLVLNGATTIPIHGLQTSISHLPKTTLPIVPSLPISAMSSTLTSGKPSNGTGSPQSSTFAQVSSSSASSISIWLASVFMGGLAGSLSSLF